MITRIREGFSSLRGQLLRSLLIFSLVPLIVIGIISIMQSRQSIIAAELANAYGISRSNVELILAWVETRRDEIRYLSKLDVFKQMDASNTTAYLRELSDLHGYYDTIFLIPPDGTAVAGVEWDAALGRTTVLSDPAVRAFQVSDRDWFQGAIAGNDVISEVLLSRASGNMVFTVASPIYDGNRIVGVVRGAVDVTALLEKIEGLQLAAGTEAYLVDAEGKPLTPVRSVVDSDAPLDTQAVRSLLAKQNGSGLYNNAAGSPVLGTYRYIPVLQWGLIIEVDQGMALGAANDLVTNLRKYLLSGAFVTLLLALSAASLVSGRIARPIAELSICPAALPRVISRSKGSF